MKAATYFRGGMQMGSVCGAITGSLIALGMAGIDDPQISNDLIRKVRDNHNGMIHCADLLRVNAQNGGENSSIFSRYLSLLTIGLGSMSLQDLSNCTMFQLYDLFERYMLFINWDIDVRTRLAGGKPDSQPDNWMKNIH